LINTTIHVAINLFAFVMLNREQNVQVSLYVKGFGAAAVHD